LLESPHEVPHHQLLAVLVEKVEVRQQALGGVGWLHGVPFAFLGLGESRGGTHLAIGRKQDKKWGGSEKRYSS
jgi:hypothetical protein